MSLRSLVQRSDRSNGRGDNIFGTLQREVDRLFDEFSHVAVGTNGSGVNLLPNIDVRESDKEIEVTAELPGLERGDIDISIDDSTMTIRGEKRMEKTREDGAMQVAERVYGSFVRAFVLPAGTDPSQIQATMNKGVLKITIPKATRSETKKIEVKEAA